MKAIEPAVRFYEKPPTHGMTVETHWSDVWLSADDWAEAFKAPRALVRRTTRRANRSGTSWSRFLSTSIDDEDLSTKSGPHLAATKHRAGQHPQESMAVTQRN